MRFMVLLALALAAAPAFAQDDDRPRIRLVYEAPPECPQIQAFRDRVASRLGYDPFDDARASEVHVAVHAGRRGFTASVTLDGDVRGRRELGPSSTCGEITNATAMTVSILLDPLATGAAGDPVAPAVEPSHAEPPAAEPAPVPPPAIVAPPPATPPAPERAAAEMLIAVDAGAAFGLAPNVSFDVSAALGLSIERSFRIEAAAAIRHTLVSVDVDGAPAAIATYAARLSGCGDVDILLACGDLELGAHSAPTLAGSNTSALHAGIGARGGVEIEIARGISVRVLAAVLVPVARLGIVLDDRVAWDAPPIAASLVAGLVASPASW